MVNGVLLWKTISVMLKTVFLQFCNFHRLLSNFFQLAKELTFNLLAIKKSQSMSFHCAFLFGNVSSWFCFYLYASNSTLIIKQSSLHPKFRLGQCKYCMFCKYSVLCQLKKHTECMQKKITQGNILPFVVTLDFLDQ